ncbi:hypothetical protein FRC01_001935 [Tulasnella sp. 417]|nr:hypothetical protein FRC01_001935 [Tulasnella sp. 417]
MLPQATQPSNELSKYHTASFAARRAGTPGETASTEFSVQSFDVEANIGEVIAPVPLPHTPSVPSSHHVRPIEQSERAPAREVRIAYTAESFGALFQQKNEDVSTMLSTAGLAQARRRRLRAATIRGRRMVEDFGITDLDLANLGAAFLAGPADDDASVKHGLDTRLSAGDEADTSPAEAPVLPDAPLHEGSTESTTQPASLHEIHYALESETVAPEFFLVNLNVLVPTSPAEAVADSEREDLSMTDFDLANLGAAFLAGPADGDDDDDDDEDASVNNEADTRMSAGDGANTSPADAPRAPNPPMHENSSEYTIQPASSHVRTAGEPSEIHYALESEMVAPPFSLVNLNVLVSAGQAEAVADSEREEISITDFDLANLGAAFLAGPVDDDDDSSSANNEGDTNMSASEEVEASHAVAPTVSNPPLHQTSGEPTIQIAPSDVQATTEPPKSNYPVESDEGDLSGLYWQFRDSWALPALLISVVEEDDMFFYPPLRGEIVGEQAEINHVIECGRVEPEFSLVNRNVLVAAGSANDDDSERDKSLSARDEVDASPAVAPPPPDSPLHENSGQPMTQAVPSDSQATTELPETSDALGVEAVDPSCPSSPWRDSLELSAPLISFSEEESFFSPPLRGELDMATFGENDQPTANAAEGNRIVSDRSSYDPALQSVSIANANNRSSAGSPDIDAKLVQRERDTSAGHAARSSSLVAPPEPTAVYLMEPVGIIVQVIPPSPTDTIEPSQSNLIAQRRAMRRYNPHRQPTDRRASTSPAGPDGPGVVDGQAGLLTVPPFRKSRSRRRRTAESSQSEDVVARLNGRGLDPLVGFIEKPTDAHTEPINIEGFSESRPSPPNAETVPTSGYPGDSVKRWPPPATPQIPVSPSSSAESGRRNMDTRMELSAASEATPSSFAAPIRSPAVLRKKPKKVTKVFERLGPPPARQQPRSLTSRVTSSLRGWGAAALRLLPGRRRSATAEGNGAVNPYFDPWEGFVPPRGPSPETAPGARS